MNRRIFLAAGAMLVGSAVSAAAAGASAPSAFAAPVSAAPLPQATSVVLKQRPLRLPPLLWIESDREEDSRLFMAALLYWDVKDRDVSHRLLFPIFYQWREGDRRFLMSLPLVASYSRPGERWLLAGPFFRRQDEEKTQTLVFPLYWRRVRAAGGRVTSFPPFIFYDYHSRDDQKIDTAFLLGFHRRRGDLDMGAVIPYFWRSSPEGRFRVVFPLWWRARSPELRYDVLAPFYNVWTADPVLMSTQTAWGRRRIGLFPLTGAGWGTDYRSHHLLPFYFYERDGDRRSFITLPYSRFSKDDGRWGHVGLYYYTHDPDLLVDGVFPLWMRRRSSDGFESKTQILNFWYERENEDVFHMVFPLYGHWSTPEGSRTLSWGYWRKTDAEGTAGWAGLYFWKSAVDGDRHRIFFPVYWHVKRDKDWRLDVVFPLYMRCRDGETTVTAVPPFILRTSPGRRTLSLFFLYWHDRDGDRSLTTFAPLFLNRSGPDRRSFFSPVAWTRRSSLSREGIIPPVYWYRSAEARRTFIVPIYWDVKTASLDLWILPPAYRWRRGEIVEVGFFPLWGRRSARVETTVDGAVQVRREPRGGYLFPFYWSDIDGKGNGTWIIPPILGFVGKTGTGTENEKFAMQYLLFGSVRKSTSALEHGFFPLYQYVRYDGNVNWWGPRGLALAAYEKKGDKRFGEIFPWFRWRAPDGDRDLVLPLFYRSRTYAVDMSTDGARRGERISGAMVVFPLWWSGADQTRSYVYVPPLYASDREGARRWRMVSPLWVSYDGATGRKFRVLFPLYWHVRSADPDADAVSAVRREISVIGPFYKVDSWKDGRRTRTVGVAPFFSRSSAGPDDQYTEILGGLFARDVQGGRRRFRFLWFFTTRPK